MKIRTERYVRCHVCTEGVVFGPPNVTLCASSEEFALLTGTPPTTASRRRSPSFRKPAPANTRKH